jgi:hypothetical protein
MEIDARVAQWVPSAERWMASRSRACGRNFDTKAESATPAFFDRYFLPSAAPLSTYNPGRLQ